MNTFAIKTLGCKVNQYESQQIRELFEQLGLNQAETSKQKADIVVINTCCVTHTASAKSRQYIRQAQKSNPDAAVIVCGCLPTVQTGELDNLGKDIHFIRYRNNLSTTLSQITTGSTAKSGQTVNSKTTILSQKNTEKAAISRQTADSKFAAPDSKNPQTCQNSAIRTEQSNKIKHKLPNQLKLSPLTSFKGHTRAFLKIQDGCDGYCSYCIIPKTRPYVHSKAAEAVLQEAQALVEAGHKEIVVTGIFLGAYGQTSARRKNWDNRQNDKLAELLGKLAEIPNLARIRLSSLEPGDVTEQLLETFCKYRNIMPHLHLSLQSGSEAVLKKMCRQYNIGEFKNKIELIKGKLDRPAITTDIIVGFPGETDADFRQTVDLARQVGFAKMHIFSFSARKGTAAASLQGKVDNRVIKMRSKILRELDAELGHKFRQQFVGENDMVLVENNNGQVCGRSQRYFIVQLEKTGKKIQKNDLVSVKLIKNRQDRIIGQVK